MSRIQCANPITAVPRRCGVSRQEEMVQRKPGRVDVLGATGRRRGPANLEDRCGGSPSGVGVVKRMPEQSPL